MKGKRQKKTKMTFDNKVTLVDCCISVITYIQAAGERELSKGIFDLMLSILIVMFFLIFGGILQKNWEEFNEFRRSSKTLEEDARKSIERKKLLYYDKRELKDDFVARCLANIVKRSKVFLGVVLTISIICMCNPNNAHAYWENVKELVGVDNKEKVSEPQGEMVEENAEKDEALQAERDMEWRFVLDNPARIYTLDSEREKQVFFYSEKNASEYTADVQESVKQWQLNPKSGVEYTNVEDELGNNYFTYTNMEDDFLDKVEQASQYTYMEEWLNYAPHSAERDSYIIGRENLNKVEMEGQMGCYQIWWMLANDYQYYAQEYEEQTENDKAVLYYYVNSIYCCMEALKYAISEEEYNKTYHYMVMRYHDMFRDKCIISQEYKEKAEDIYLILVEDDVLSQESK